MYDDDFSQSKKKDKMNLMGKIELSKAIRIIDFNLRSPSLFIVYFILGPTMDKQLINFINYLKRKQIHI